MSATAAIALNVFRESVRDKVLYNLVLFAILLIGASYLIGQLTAGQDVKIIKDLGLSATSVFGLFIAVFIGIGLVSKEVERRSVYSLLAKTDSPVSNDRRQICRAHADAGRQRRDWAARAQLIQSKLPGSSDPSRFKALRGLFGTRRRKFLVSAGLPAL